MRLGVLCIVLLLCITAVTATKEKQAAEEAKTYELIDIWDKTIRIDPLQISPSGQLVSSYRELTVTPTQLLSYKYTQTFEQSQSLVTNNLVQKTFASLDEQTYGPASPVVHFKSYAFQNTNYPKFIVDRTQVKVVVPAIENAQSTVYTLIRLPIDDAAFVPQDVPNELRLQVFPDGDGALFLIAGQGAELTVIADTSMTSDHVDAVQATTFHMLPPPVIEEKEPEVQQPAVIVAQEPEPNAPIGAYAFSAVLVFIGLALGLWYKRHIRMRELMTKYGGAQTSEEPKEKHGAFDHLHQVINKIRHRNT